MRIGEIVSDGIAVVEESTSIRSTVELIKTLRLDALPVVGQNGRLVGLVTKSSIYSVIINNIPTNFPTGTIMVRDPQTLRTSDSLASMKAVIPTSHVSQAPVLDDTGVPVGLFTRSVAVNALLKEAELLTRHLSTVVESVDYGVIAVDAYGRISVFNRAAVALTGLHSEDVLTLPIAEVIPQLQLHEVLVTGRSLQRQKVLLNSRTILVNSHPVLGATQTIGAAATLHDATAEDELIARLKDVQQLNHTLGTVLETAYDGIIAVDKLGRVIFMNKSLCDFLSVSSQTFIGRHVTDVVENTQLHIVAQTGVAQHRSVQMIQDTICVVTQLPLKRDGQLDGAVGKIVFYAPHDWHRLTRQLENVQPPSDSDGTALAYQTRFGFEHIVGVSLALERVRYEAYRAALNDVPVLITGPTGTGKELFAHAIHNAGPRQRAPFVKVNCAALPAELLESEFFGYAAGAFTGALKQGKPGKFELANGGTLFLDEIGDMSPNLQAKLLHVLQDGEFVRVGGTKPVRVNVRIISATHRDLNQMIAEKSFRQDLYYRLNVLSLELPPLAERADDIEPLIEVFITRHNAELGLAIRGITPVARKLLLQYPWPGNGRELENAIRRAMVMATSEYLETKDLPPHISRGHSTITTPTAAVPSPLQSKRITHERQLIEDAIAAAGGNKKLAAKNLGISRAGLYTRLKRLGMSARK